MLYRAPALTSKDREVLAGIDEMRDALRHQVRQSPAKCWHTTQPIPQHADHAGSLS